MVTVEMQETKAPPVRWESPESPVQEDLEDPRDQREPEERRAKTV